MKVIAEIKPIETMTGDEILALRKSGLLREYDPNSESDSNELELELMTINKNWQDSKSEKL